MSVELLTTTADRQATEATMASLHERAPLRMLARARFDVARGYARRLTWWERLLGRTGA